ELVVFDMAGTTVAEGGAVYECLRDTLAANGLGITANALHEVKGMDKREALRTLIDRLGWERDELIDASVTSDEVERGRPHPDMIQRLMRKLGITDPRRVAKVGDTPADLLEGKNAGCGLVVGVTQGSSAPEQLSRFPHDHLLRSVAE